MGRKREGAEHVPRKRNTEKGFENSGENGQGWKIMLLGKMAPSSIANGSHEENPGIFFYFVLLVPEKKTFIPVLGHQPKELRGN